MEPWVVGSNPSKRYPLWTRANVGEVFPDPVAPLTHTLFLREHVEGGWRDALVKMGAFSHDEFAPGEMETVGVFGSYCYLNVSVARLIGVRAPGMTAEDMDNSFFGAQPGIPPYTPAAGDENEALSAKIGATFQWVMSTDHIQESLDGAVLADSWRARRPNLELMTNEELWAHSKEMWKDMRQLFSDHIYVTFLSPIPVGALAQICAAVGRPGDAMKVISGVGDVESAAPSLAMWKLGRLVAADPGLMAAFDQGVEGLMGRLKEDASPAATAFLAAFKQFIADYGSRGPNEWEMRSPTWETRPELPLAAIDRMRLAPESAAPEVGQRRMAADRERIVAEISAMLAGDPATQGTFLAAARAATVFQAGRERTKTNCVKVIEEARMAMYTIGKRMVAAGLADEVTDFGLVKAGEFDAWLADPTPLRAEIARRRALMAQYAGLREPFVFVGTPPPAETWEPRESNAPEQAKAGDVLTGFPGCAGQVTGIARVVLDAGDPTALDPGDILVAPITDPSWTPLFVSAGGVVVNVGAAQSHAMIVSRELGIPCVPSVTDATRRIPHGATITVDGDAGTVTIVSVP